MQADAAAVGGARVVVGDTGALADLHPLELLDALEHAGLRIAWREDVDEPRAVHRFRIGKAEQARRGRIGLVDDAATVQIQRRRRTLEQLAISRLARRRCTLCAQLLGDVAGDAPIAGKDAFGVELWLAADAVHAQPAGGVAPAYEQAGERLVRFEVGTVRVDLRLRHADRLDVPWRMADLRLQRERVDQAARGDRVREAELAVLLPIEIGREAQQVARMALALGGGAQVVRDDASDEHAGAQPGADDHAQHQEHELAAVCGHAGHGRMCGGATQQQQLDDGQQRQGDAGANAGHGTDDAHHQRQQAERRIAQAVVEQQRERADEQHRADGRGIQRRVQRKAASVGCASRSTRSARRRPPGSRPTTGARCRSEPAPRTGR